MFVCVWGGGGGGGKGGVHAKAVTRGHFLTSIAMQKSKCPGVDVFLYTVYTNRQQQKMTSADIVCIFHVNNILILTCILT